MESSNGKHHTVQSLPHLEDKYLDQLVLDIVRFGSFRQGGSLLVIGGSNWHFAKGVSDRSNAASCVYVTDDKSSLLMADEEDDALTVECDVTSPIELAKLAGKYDAIVVKNALAHVDTGSGDYIEQLEEYLVALYKILKYGGKVALLLPQNFFHLPNLPYCEKSVATVTNRLNFEQIEKAAVKSEFEFKSKCFKYKVQWSKDEYSELVTKSTDLKNIIGDGLENNEVLENLPETICYDDGQEIVLLAKELDED